MEMDIEDAVGASSWASLNRDVLERIGCELALRELLSARTVCRQWRQHMARAVRHLPHPHQRQQRHLVELDAQPAGGEAVWQQSLADLASCLPHLSEVMVYVSSRVSEERLGAQLRSLPAALPALTKLELRYIVPSSAPCLGTTLQQLQPALTALTGLETLYLIMGASPEPPEVAAVLPALSALRDLKLLSGLPQYGFTNAKLAALGCASQLQRLHLEVSGVGQVDAGLGALAALTGLRELWLDGLVTLGQAVVGAMAQLPDLQALRLELDSPQHIPDLFALPGLKRLSLTYHGDELDDADEAAPPPAPPDAPAANGNVPGAAGGAGPGAGGGGGSGTDWDALERLVRGHSERPVLVELGLLSCSFPADPLPRLALLTSITSLSFYDCRWKAATPPRHPAATGAAGMVTAPGKLAVTTPGTLAAAAAAAATAAAAAPPRPPDAWGALSSLVGLQAFGMAQCVVPPISEWDLASLATSWPGVTSLQLQSADYRASELPLLAARPQPAAFGAFLCLWRRLEALTLSGSWCNDPRVCLDVSLLPPSLTSLVVSSVTLTSSTAAETVRAAILGQRQNVAQEGTVAHARATGASLRFYGRGAAAEAQGVVVGVVASCSRADSAGSAGVMASACDGDSSAGGGGQAAGASSSSDRDGSCGLDCGAAGCASCRPCPAPCRSGAASAASAAVAGPALSALEHLVLGEVRLGAGVSLERLVAWAPNLRSLEINNLMPNLTDDSVAALAALTALTVLRVSQDQDPDSGAAAGDAAAAGDSPPTNGHHHHHHLQPHPQQLLQRPGPLSGMGLSALTGLRSLRQLEWLPWGCEPLGLEHVGALSALRRLHLVTLRGARDGAISEAALEAMREALPLCDIDDTEWSGLVDV